MVVVTRIFATVISVVENVEVAVEDLLMEVLNELACYLIISPSSWVMVVYWHTVFPPSPSRHFNSTAGPGHIPHTILWDNHPISSLAVVALVSNIVLLHSRGSG